MLRSDEDTVQGPLLLLVPLLPLWLHWEYWALTECVMGNSNTKSWQLERQNNMTQCAHWPTLSSHVASNIKTKFRFILDCVWRYNTLCSTQHQQKDPCMSELPCFTVSHFPCTQTSYTWESLTNHVLVTLFILFSFDMTSGEHFWGKQHMYAYVHVLLSEKNNLRLASYYYSHPAERTFAADRMNLKTLKEKRKCGYILKSFCFTLHS